MRTTTNDPPRSRLARLRDPGRDDAYALETGHAPIPIANGPHPIVEFQGFGGVQMIVVRALRDLVGRNLVQPYSISVGTELLAEAVSHEDYERSTACRGLIGADWPVGKVVLRLFDERFANGEAFVVGVEGADWKVVPGKAG